MNVFDLDLTESQRMMREACRKFVDDTITPFVLKNWKNEWNMTPEERLPNSILQEADSLGIRTLGVPEEFGGMSLEKEHEVRTFAIISEEIEALILADNSAAQPPTEQIAATAAATAALVS